MKRYKHFSQRYKFEINVAITHNIYFTLLFYLLFNCYELIYQEEERKAQGVKNRPKKKAATDVNDSFEEEFRDTNTPFPSGRNEEEDDFLINDDGVALYEGDINGDIRLSGLVAAADQLDEAAESRTN